MNSENSDKGITVLKSKFITLSEDRVMFIIYYYKSFKENKKKSFYKSAIKTGSINYWKQISENFRHNNPAEILTMSSIGLNDKETKNDILRINKRQSLNIDFAKLIENKLKKILTIEEFRTENNKPTSYPFPYVIEDINYLENHEALKDETWYIWTKEKLKERKKYGRVIY